MSNHVQKDNPFLALFGPPEPEEDASSPSLPKSPSPTSAEPDSVSVRRQKLNDLLEHVFQITLNQYRVLGQDDANGRLHLVFLRDLADELGPQQQSWLDLALLERALFERLVLEDVARHVLSPPAPCVDESRRKKQRSPDLAPSGHVVETRCVVYLAEAYRRAAGRRRQLGDNEAVTPDDLAAVERLIVQNAATALREPDLYHPQDLVEQALAVLAESAGDADGVDVDLLAFLEAVVKEIKTEDERQAREVVKQMLLRVHRNMQEVPLVLLNASHLQPVHYFTRTPVLSRLFMLHNQPASPTSGRSYGDTLLGDILCKSCLPKNEMSQPFDFFESPSRQSAGVHASTEARIWTMLTSSRDQAFNIFKRLLRAGEDTKHLTLMWIGDCFKANAGRGKMWTSEMGGLLGNAYASDGFMLNLGSVLMRLCDPFTAQNDSPKLLKIDPAYTSAHCVVSEDARLKNVHLRDADGETFLIPRTTEDGTDDNEASAKTFNFVTDVFFLTHKCLDLGFRVVQEKFVKLGQELNRIQQQYREVQQQDPQLAETVQQRMDNSMTRYLSLKAALLEPESLRLRMQLSSSTASWLVQLAINPDLASSSFARLSFPLSPSPAHFRHVPEFLVENICEHLLLGRRFLPKHFEEHGDRLPSLVDFVLTFMASPGLVRNPHLRARMAEALECMLPGHEQPAGGGGIASLGSFQRQQLFLAHPHRLEIVPTLLHVFVDIEATGQAVQFEQKFSYRRPMYDVMKYLWDMEEYRQKFLSMAEHAEQHIEAEDAPLFLRFANLLINDAIFLLDEALGYMKQIQEQQLSMESWSELPATERSTRQQEYSHMGRLARYHNIMGMETIEMLDRLTAHIKDHVFTHPTMVDRIAAMLNYFLKNLVGPERKNFKVKNLEDYDFRPGDIVSTICQIYVNLSSSPAFPPAVSRDARSYSPSLFPQAENVLLKIGRTGCLADLRDLADQVTAASADLEADDALFADAPDHYLDPIMSVLMREPVKLPASGQIVDKQTIARHLLSDQNDPFNREPLTLDKVIPQDDLRREIEEWMRKKREEAKK